MVLYLGRGKNVEIDEVKIGLTLFSVIFADFHRAGKGESTKMLFRAASPSARRTIGKPDFRF